MVAFAQIHQAPCFLVAHRTELYRNHPSTNISRREPSASGGELREAARATEAVTMAKHEKVKQPTMRRLIRLQVNPSTRLCMPAGFTQNSRSARSSSTDKQRCD